MPKSPTSSLVTFFSLLVAAAGCGDLTGLDPETDFVPESQEADQVIVGELGWVDVGTLDSASQERRNSHAVGYISIPAKGTRCTGFLINDNTVMTNEHCISNQSEANNATVSFRREAGVPFSEWASYSCDEFLGDSSALDYALLRCEGNPGANHGVLELDAYEAPVSHQLYVIQQNCDYYNAPGCSPTKKIAWGQVTRRDSEFRHNADTLGGSSGSPVFSSSSHKVFALHHVGVGNNGNGRGSYNYAVPMVDILPHVQQNHPGLTLGPGGGQVDPAPTGDDFEPNNDVGAATNAPFPSSGTGLTIGASDVDVFAVEVAAEGTLEVDLSFSHGAGDLDVSLHKDALNNPALAKGDSANDDEQLRKDGLAPGTYYVVVYGYNGATNTYDVSFDFIVQNPNQGGDGDGDGDPTQTGDGDGDGDPTQNADDDTIATANVVSLPHAAADAISAAGDEDFFSFTTSGGLFTATLGFVHADGDLDLYLYDAAGQQLASSLSVNDSESISQDLSGGTYFVRVIGYDGATGAYTLNLD